MVTKRLTHGVFESIKSLGYKYDESQHQITSREISANDLRESFQIPDWAFDEDNGEFTITHAGFVIVAEIHGWDVEIAKEVETYLCELSSECGSGKEIQSQHKQLLRDMWKMLPWDWKMAVWVVNDGRLMLKYSSDVKGTAEPHEVISRRRQECSFPDKIARQRRQPLRMKPATSYLGTRIKPPPRHRSILRNSVPLTFRVVGGLDSVARTT